MIKSYFSYTCMTLWSLISWPQMQDTYMMVIHPSVLMIVQWQAYCSGCLIFARWNIASTNHWSTSTSWMDHRPFPFTISYCLTFHEYSLFLLTSAKCLPLLNAKNDSGGLDEMDKMNQAEVIYDNSCFLSFVCLTYNLKIAWQNESTCFTCVL